MVGVTGIESATPITFGAEADAVKWRANVSAASRVGKQYRR
jgi:hypothetical protein